jgi:hypothetical protein
MELKVPCSDGQISGQYKPTQNILAMFLFDLQIAAFLVLKNGKFIADMHSYEVGFIESTK